MDDIVIFAETKEELHRLHAEIEEYFRDNLKLRVKGNWAVFPTYVRGVDFLGYRVFKDYTLLRKNTCKKFKKKMTAIRTKVESGQMMNYSEWCSINSYHGWTKHCNSFRLCRKYYEPLVPYSNQYYETVIKPKSKKGKKAA